MNIEVSTSKLAAVLEPVRDKIAEFENQIEKIAVDTDADAAAVADLVKAARTRRKALWENERRTLVDPLNDHVKWINAQFKPECDALQKIESVGTRKLDEHRRRREAEHRAEMKRQQEAEAKKRREEEDKRLAEAERLEKSGKREEAEAALSAPETPAPPTPARKQQPIRGGMGATAHKRRIRKVRVVDWAKVPPQYLKLDERAALDADKAGHTVPGLEFYDDEQTVVR